MRLRLHRLQKVQTILSSDLLLVHQHLLRRRSPNQLQSDRLRQRRNQVTTGEMHERQATTTAIAMTRTRCQVRAFSRSVQVLQVCYSGVHHLRPPLDLGQRDPMKALRPDLQHLLSPLLLLCQSCELCSNTVFKVFLLIVDILASVVPLLVHHRLDRRCLEPFKAEHGYARLSPTIEVPLPEQGALLAMPVHQYKNTSLRRLRPSPSLMLSRRMCPELRTIIGKAWTGTAVLLLTLTPHQPFLLLRVSILCRKRRNQRNLPATPA